MNTIANGVWPTMITPFTENNAIDYAALDDLVEWYISNNVHGLFAVCQSSEMFYLTLEERVRLAEHVKKQAGNRVPVIASGHISDSLDDQVEEIKRIADTGVDAVVIVTNRLAHADESDDAWIANAEKLLHRIPDVNLGLYECPQPYKRLMSPDVLKWCADTNRFLFLKDTCCNSDQIEAKLNAVSGSNLKIFNANSATLLSSLQLGAAGFSGVMANFHPDLYVWLVDNWNTHQETARIVQSLLGTASMIERGLYPINARYSLQLEGLNIGLHGRSKNAARFDALGRLEVQQLYELCQSLRPLVFKR